MIRLFVYAVAISVATPKHATTPIQIPKETPVVVQTYNAINSATFHTGERLAYTVTEDVIVNGAVVAKKGDVAEGLVENAQQGKDVKAGRIATVVGPLHGAGAAAADKAASKPANLQISIKDVHTFCGGVIHLSFVRTESQKPKHFEHSQPTVEIAKGQKYVAMVANDTSSCGFATTRTPAPIPGDALPADQSR